MKILLNIVIPSRPQSNQIVFLEGAIASVRNQSIADQCQLNFLVGVDKGHTLDSLQCASLGIQCIESNGASQSAALNAAIKHVKDGYIAFLEDDDRWVPDYLRYALDALARCGFVSSTQLELDQCGVILRINDFPTPSGWLMPLSTLHAVGLFDESYRFHMDSDWLGRLAEVGIPRIHLAESTAPIRFMEQVRPLLYNVLQLSKGYCLIERHSLPYPLVNRLVHEGSGIAQILNKPELSKISEFENERLVARYGRAPC